MGCDFMDKNVYDMLNDININLEELSKDKFDDIEKKQIKNKFKKSINKDKNKNRKKDIIAATIVGAISIGIIGSNFGTSVAAAIRFASIDIGSFLGISKNLDMYKTTVDKTESNNGITIKLNEAVLNGNELVVSTTINYDKNNSKIKSIHAFGEIFINGNKMSTSSAGTGKFIKDSEFQDVSTYSIKSLQLKGNSDVKIVYSSILLNGEEVKINPYIFEFTTNGDKLASDTVRLPINHSFTLENGNIVKITNYESNSISKKFALTIENNKNSKTVYGIQLRGYDDCGNKIVFEPVNMSDKQGMLKLSTVLGQEISDKATKITLSPYAIAYPEQNIRLSSDYKQVGEEFTVKVK